MKTYEAKYPKAVQCLVKDRDALLAFYDFPAEHWMHLGTTNPVESAFATIRHRTDQAKGCVTRNTMLTFIFKLGMCAEKRWNRIRGFNHLAQVIAGVKFKDGVEVAQENADNRDAPDHVAYTRFDNSSVPIEVDEHLTFLQIDALDFADVPIEDILVIVSVIVEFEGFGSIFGHFGRGRGKTPLKSLTQAPEGGCLLCRPKRRRHAVCHAFLANSTFHDLLFRFDQDLAASVQAACCTAPAIHANHAACRAACSGRRMRLG